MSDIDKGSYSHRQHGELMPKAVVHKKILDAAMDHPEASIERLADEINGASEQLIKHTFDKYGDPATFEDETQPEGEEKEDSSITSEKQNEPETECAQPCEITMNSESTDASVNASATGESSDSPMDEANQVAEAAGDSADNQRESVTDTGAERSTSPPQSMADPPATGTDRITDEGGTGGEFVSDPSQFTEKQQQVLRAINERPHATQAELAEEFDVSRATISQRVNAIDGFDWSNRKEFVEIIYQRNDKIMDGDEYQEVIDELTTQVDLLFESLDALEQSVDELSSSEPAVFGDPELVATVIRACIDSEYVTEEQEEQIIRELMKSGRPRDS